MYYHVLILALYLVPSLAILNHLLWALLEETTRNILFGKLIEVELEVNKNMQVWKLPKVFRLGSQHIVVDCM